MSDLSSKIGKDELSGQGPDGTAELL
jgi:hypothetical protein